MTLSGRKCSRCWRSTALEGQDEAQAVDVARRELAVARLGSVGGDELLLFEESQFRRRQIGELRAELREHLTDAEQGTFAGLASRGGGGPCGHQALEGRSCRDA